jgi:MYXO-CTERM domain-containing protein
MLTRPLLAAATLAALASSAKAAAPAPPTVLISSVTVTEGHSGLTPFEATVSMAPYGPQGGPYLVDITVSPGSASEADYVFTPFRLMVGGGYGPQTVRGFVVGDTAYEGDETFTLTAVPAAGSGAGYFFSQGGQVTIDDDDGEPPPRVTIDPKTFVAEGSAGWHWIEVPVRLSSALPNPVSFNFETTGGQPGLDYRPTFGTATIKPGTTLVNIPVEIYGDTVVERDSSFEIKLSNVQGSPFDGGVGLVVITDDDAPIATRVWADDVFTAEGDAGRTQATVHFHFDPPVPGDTKLALTIEGGSARAGEDFVSRAFETIYPPPGATDVAYTIQIEGDTHPEPDEDIVIRYQAIYAGDDTFRTVRVTIVDDDPTPPSRGPGNPALDDALPGREGCACSSATDAPSLGALLLLGAVFLTVRRRRASTPRGR